VTVTRLSPLAQAFTWAVSLLRLRAAHPEYHVWIERRYGSRVRWAAQRRSGVSCQPFAVVSADPAELAAILPCEAGTSWLTAWSRG
jgi:hypothetical protein